MVYLVLDLFISELIQEVDYAIYYAFHVLIMKFIVQLEERVSLEAIIEQPQNRK